MLFRRESDYENMICTVPYGVGTDCKPVNSWFDSGTVLYVWSRGMYTDNLAGHRGGTGTSSQSK